MAYVGSFEGRRGETILRTNLKTYGGYKSYADTEYEKRRAKNHKKVIEEINRRNIDGYGV